jgi:hypothetical protein
MQLGLFTFGDVGSNPVSGAAWSGVRPGRAGPSALES